MDNPEQIFDKMQKVASELRKCHKRARTLAKEKAKAEGNYRVKLRQYILELREEGQPVTIINDLARGEGHIASLKFQRDLKSSLYDVERDLAFSLRQELEVYRSKLAWLKAEIRNEI